MNYSIVMLNDCRLSWNYFNRKAMCHTYICGMGYLCGAFHTTHITQSILNPGGFHSRHANGGQLRLEQQLPWGRLTKLQIHTSAPTDPRTTALSHKRQVKCFAQGHNKGLHLWELAYGWYFCWLSICAAIHTCSRNQGSADQQQQPVSRALKKSQPPVTIWEQQFSHCFWCCRLSWTPML